MKSIVQSSAKSREDWRIWVIWMGHPEYSGLILHGFETEVVEIFFNVSTTETDEKHGKARLQSIIIPIVA